METKVQEFENELGIFRTEVESGTQFFYSYLSIVPALTGSDEALKFANRAPLFWRTVIGSLQMYSIIVLGRIFDQSGNNHGVDRLIKLAQTNIEMFSKKSLAARKRKGSSNVDEWLENYLGDVYVPGPSDFRMLRQHVSGYRKKYEPIKNARNKVIAHREALTIDELTKIDKEMKVQEFQKIWVFLKELEETMWELFHNGRKPVLSPADQMRKNPRPKGDPSTLQGRVEIEIQEYFDWIITSLLKQDIQENNPLR